MTTTSNAEPEILSWKVTGMDCGGCAAKVRGAIEKMPGVSDVSVSLMSETLKVTLAGTTTSGEAIAQRVLMSIAVNARRRG